MICIGDTHAKILELLLVMSLLPKSETIYQLGDMGLGFKGVWLPDLYRDFKFIRGNHDSPDMCRMHHNYLGDYGYIPEQELFFLGGAYSIDAAHRIPGVSWWFDEELPYTELQKAIDLYIEKKPKIVISHEAPAEAAKNMLYSIGILGGYEAAKLACSMSRTSEALQRMVDAHKPREWVFGHYHMNKDFIWKGTHFHCCNELAVYRIPE